MGRGNPVFATRVHRAVALEIENLVKRAKANGTSGPRSPGEFMLRAVMEKLAHMRRSRASSVRVNKRRKEGGPS